MKNYKSLDATRFFLSGWVQTVFCIQPEGLSDIFILKADVKPSYKVNDPPHCPWVAAQKDGGVVAAHCDCKAGLVCT